MIQELAEFGKRVNKGKSRALKEENYSIVIVIDEDGVFKKFLLVDPSSKIESETITAKKGKSRFLLDKCEEVLGVGEGDVNRKHKLFIEKLECYKTLNELDPIFKFYNEENKNGLEKAKADFEKLDANDQRGNITFMVCTTLLLKTEEVKNAIIKRFEEEEQKLANGRICSICGSTQIPVLDEPHGLVKMPKGQSAGSALVSYNENAFESYGLEGNLNSSICRRCARNYIDGLRFLLSDGHQVEGSDKKKYTHRFKISDTTVAIFWTKQETSEENPFVFCNIPSESEVKDLFESVQKGDSRIKSVFDTNMFYSCTLSSVAARIAVRDWTAISLDEYKCNIADWFLDIEIEDYDGALLYSPLAQLIDASQRYNKSGKSSKSDLNSKARIGSILWNAAIKGRSYMIPLEVLQSIMIRIYDKGVMSPHRAAIIKLIINRNTNKNMKSSLDESNRSVAYLCGRLFAVIESMQWKAIGNVNSGVKERFFAAAVSQPACIFGTLLTKNVPIYQHKIGGYLAKELNEIAAAISESGSFPQRFTLIEQGEFALGYYFQQKNRTTKKESENTNF